MMLPGKATAQKSVAIIGSGRKPAEALAQTSHLTRAQGKAKAPRAPPRSTPSHSNTQRAKPSPRLSSRTHCRRSAPSSP
ncbi:hypothetical protein U9M48_030301 [Paspalum notatum var. saurae]|uniref:Uncharacterized protein n=1 Tax=Paspalum notatum var. saurae TaxID=547442 RepID=A0AAQ3X3L9_PASNO